MKSTNFTGALAAIAIIFATIQVTSALVSPKRLNTVRAEPEIIDKVDDLMDELREYARSLPPQHNLLAQEIMTLQNNVRMLIRMESSSENKLFSHVCTEFDDFFRPPRPTYHTKSAPDIPPMKLARFHAGNKLKSVYGRLQQLWLAKITEAERQKREAERADAKK